MTCCSLYRAVSICSLRWKKTKEAKCRCQLKPAEDHCFTGLCFLLWFAINIFLDFRHTSSIVPGVSAFRLRGLISFFLFFLLFKGFIFSDTKKDVWGQQSILLHSTAKWWHIRIFASLTIFFKAHSHLYAEDLEISWEDHLKWGIKTFQASHHNCKLKNKHLHTPHSLT